MFEPKALANNKHEVKMYGTISQWEKVNAIDFCNAVDEVMNKGAKEIIFPIHSGGGSIYEGIAMGNKVQEARAKGIKTIARVDGLAASMAAVFSAHCDETYVADNTRMMVHEGKTISIGNVQTLREDADELESLNNDIAEVFAKKTGQTKEWILQNWMSSGKNKWFNSQEAVNSKLANKKIPAVERKLPTLSNSTSWERMAASYDKVFETENSNPDNKMKEQLIKTLGLAADATDEQINEAVAKLKNPAPAAAAAAPAAAVPAPAPAASAPIANDKAIELVLKMAAERGVKDQKKLDAIKEVAKINIGAAMELLPEKQAEDALRLSDVIAELKGGSAATGGSQARKDWTFEDWEKKDPQAFHEMLSKEPKKYIALFNAAHPGANITEADLKGFAAEPK
jgi:ATP-dependent protease ClpP protease subunit